MVCVLVCTYVCVSGFEFISCGSAIYEGERERERERERKKKVDRQKDEETGVENIGRYSFHIIVFFLSLLSLFFSSLSFSSPYLPHSIFTLSVSSLSLYFISRSNFLHLSSLQSTFFPPACFVDRFSYFLSCLLFIVFSILIFIC